mmetsp:Transcript_9948/g.32244  ORF Transcript_9948/g.32244 Transcript_9948/m.32244 type:complete len:406 (+) Transcript_9948:319-1536(+)
MVGDVIESQLPLDRELEGARVDLLGWNHHPIDGHVPPAPLPRREVHPLVPELLVVLVQEALGDGIVEVAAHVEPVAARGVLGIENLKDPEVCEEDLLLVGREVRPQPLHVVGVAQLPEYQHHGMLAARRPAEALNHPRGLEAVDVHRGRHASDVRDAPVVRGCDDVLVPCALKAVAGEGPRVVGHPREADEVHHQLPSVREPLGPLELLADPEGPVHVCGHGPQRVPGGPAGGELPRHLSLHRVGEVELVHLVRVPLVEAHHHLVPKVEVHEHRVVGGDAPREALGVAEGREQLPHAEVPESVVVQDDLKHPGFEEHGCEDGAHAPAEAVVGEVDCGEHRVGAQGVGDVRAPHVPKPEMGEGEGLEARAIGEALGERLAPLQARHVPGEVHLLQADVLVQQLPHP